MVMGSWLLNWFEVRDLICALDTNLSLTFHFSLFPSERLARVVRISPMGGKEVFLCLLQSIGGGRRRHSDEASEALRWMTVLCVFFMIQRYKKISRLPNINPFIFRYLR